MIKRNNCGKALQHSRVILDILGGNACADEWVPWFFLILHLLLWIWTLIYALSPQDTMLGVTSPTYRSPTRTKVRLVAFLLSLRSDANYIKYFYFSGTNVRLRNEITHLHLDWLVFSLGHSHSHLGQGDDRHPRFCKLNAMILGGQNFNYWSSMEIG
jgi:hypothetical protein